MADINIDHFQVFRRHSRPSVAVYLILVAAVASLAVQILGLSPADAAARTSSPTTVSSKAPPRTPNPNVATFGTQTSGPTKPDSRGIYQFGATPGGRVEDYVALLNYSLKPISLILRGTDAVNTPQGGFAARPINERSTQVGAWVELPTSDLTVTVPPRSDRIVPFLVLVPANATPGDHIGVITATLESSIVSHSGQRVHLLQTVGSRIFIRVSGPVHPGFTVTGLAASYRGTANPIGTGEVKITYNVRNTGNVALGGRQTVYVSGLFGTKTVAAHVPQVQLLLPGYSVKQSVTIHGVFPEIHDSGHVSISPLYIPGSAQPASGPYTATVSFWAVPWTLLAIVVAIVLLLFVWWRRRRRRRRRRLAGKGSGKPRPPAKAVDREQGEPSPPVPSGPDQEMAPHGQPAPAPAMSQPSRPDAQAQARAKDVT